jgi:hypothetical protein
MTLALIIICLMVLLVLMDGTDRSGHGSEAADATPAEEADRAAPGRPCILAVKSIHGRDSQEPRKHAWKPARHVETETTPR